jgi:hypothetical protein
VAIALDPKKDRVLLKRLMEGGQASPGRARAQKAPRAAGERGNRQHVLDELARAGWYIYTYHAATDTHSYERRDGRVVEAASYDALLDMLLKEVRDGYV